MTTLTDRLALLITADADQAVREIGKVGKIADRDLGNATAKTGKLGGALQGLGISGAAAGTAMKAGLAAGGVALAAFAAEGVTKFVSLAAKVRDFQRASGASTEDSSRFVAVLDDMGISAEAGSAAIFKLAKKVSSGAGDLNKFGIEVTKNKDGTANLTETLLNVADAYAATPDPAKRAALAFAAFGKSGQTLLPVLEKGRVGLKEFFEGAESHGEILSGEDLKNAREFELAMDDLGDAIGGLQRNLGGDLIPLLADFANAASKVVDITSKIKDRAFKLPGFLKDAFKEALGPAGDLIPVLQSLRDKTADAEEETENLAITAQQSTEAMNANAESIGAVTKAVDANVKALDGQLDALAAQIDSTFAYEKSLNDLEDAQKTYTEAAKGDPEKTKAENAEAASRALLALKESYVSVADASARQAEDVAKAAGSALTATDRYNVYRNKLIELKDTTAPGSPLRQNLEALINALPEKRTSTITVEVDTSRVDALLAKLREARTLMTSDTGNILAGTKGGNTITNNINVPVKTNASGAEIAREISWNRRGWGPG